MNSFSQVRFWSLTIYGHSKWALTCFSTMASSSQYNIYFKYQSWPGLVTWFLVSPMANTNPGQDWSHAFQSPQWQIPILARIGHMLFSLPNGKYQSWPGLVTCFSVSPMANTNPGQDWSHAFQSPQWQIPILARIGHMLFSLPNGKYQSWPGLVTC